MPFYHYDQNNSGGVFMEPALNVFIEASSHEEADTIAEANGLYFDGVDENMDCPCCGDRWSRSLRGPLEDQDAVDAVIERNRKWDEGWSKQDRVPVSLIIRKPLSQGA
jgi:hypothetical protein